MALRKVKVARVTARNSLSNRLPALNLGVVNLVARNSLGVQLRVLG